MHSCVAVGSISYNSRRRERSLELSLSDYVKGTTVLDELGNNSHSKTKSLTLYRICTSSARFSSKIFMADCLRYVMIDLLSSDLGGLRNMQTVFKALGQWGRINLRTLFQHCDVPPQHVRHGLIVLIQQHLVLHSTSDTEDQAYYEVDWNGAYELMRVGKIVSIIEERYGSGAAQVISNLLQLGHARVGDLEDAYKFTPKDHIAVNSAAEHINGEGIPNGMHEGYVTTRPQDKKITNPEQLHSVLYQLLKDGFIARVNDRSYLSSADYTNQAEALLKNGDFRDKPTNGPKAKASFAAAVNQQKRKWREEEDEVSGDMYRGTTNGSNGPPHKRMKLNGATTNGAGRHNGPEVTLQVYQIPRGALPEALLTTSQRSATLFSRSTSESVVSPCALCNSNNSRHASAAT